MCLAVLCGVGDIRQEQGGVGAVRGAPSGGLVPLCNILGYDIISALVTPLQVQDLGPVTVEVAAQTVKWLRLCCCSSWSSALEAPVILEIFFCVAYLFR